MAETKQKEELVEVQLDQPYITNGVAHGVEVIDGKRVFTGKALVSPELAEDLQRRMGESREYKEHLLRDDGEQIQAGAMKGGGA